jgi:hypothetical protein
VGDSTEREQSERAALVLVWGSAAGPVFDALWAGDLDKVADALNELEAEYSDHDKVVLALEAIQDAVNELKSE